MKRKSRGNFTDFVEDANKKPELRKKFFATLEKKPMGEDLLKLFYSWGYDGVSLDDCDVILSTIREPRALEKLWDSKY